jgi:hypothetical protein
MKSITPKQLLAGAARVIEKHGHAKGELVSSDGRMCLMGAINKVLFDHALENGEHPSLIPALEAVCNQAFPDGDWQGYPRHAVVHWNNASDRTGQEVIDVLRAASDAIVEAA